LSGLEYFWVSGNQLTGAIPPLSGLTNLQYFDVSSNQLSGNVPAVPSPNNLAGGGSLLCPNFLNQTADAGWDAATGSTPWYLNCTASTLPVRIVETLVSYTDIQSAYNAALNGQTVEAQDGSGSQNPLLFDNPNIVSFKLSGGYNTGFTAATGATRVTGSIGVTRSGVEMEGIIIQ